MSQEIWKTVEECNLIEVSNKGNVRTVPEIIKFGDAEQEFYQRLRPHKYGRYLYVNFNSKSYSIARLVATAFVPNPNKLTLVTFKDNDCYNLHADNLRWSSRSEAMTRCLQSSNYRRSRGKSIAICCEELDTQYLDVKSCLKDVNLKLGVDIKYDTLLRHLKKSEDVCVNGIHFHR